MPLSDIIRLGLVGSLTSQQLADQALTADRLARQMERLDALGGTLTDATRQAREEADAIADECAKRARLMA